MVPEPQHPARHLAPAQGPGNVICPSGAVGPRRAGAARRARCHLGPGSCLACSFQSNCVLQPASTCLVPRRSHARRDPLHFTPREEALFLTAHYHTVVSQYSCLLIKWLCLRRHRGLPAAPAGGVGWRRALRAVLSSSRVQEDWLRPRAELQPLPEEVTVGDKQTRVGCLWG